MATSIIDALTGTTGAITPGTTPKVTFELEDTSIVSTTVDTRLDVTQDGAVILQIDDLDIDKDNNAVYHIFTQQETCAMNAGTVKMQVHGKTSDGAVWKTSIVAVPVVEVLTKTII